MFKLTLTLNLTQIVTHQIAVEKKKVEHISDHSAAFFFFVINYLLFFLFKEVIIQSLKAQQSHIQFAVATMSASKINEKRPLPQPL